MEFREQVAQVHGAKLSVNDLVLKACALALRRIPEANASFTEEAIIQHARVDIGMAVAIEDGLITPVIRDADKKTIGQIASEAREMADRARDRKLRPEEYTGATFSVSNLGMFGIRDFAAIINPPEGAILAVGTVRKEPVVKDNKIVDRPAHVDHAVVRPPGHRRRARRQGAAGDRRHPREADLAGVLSPSGRPSSFDRGSLAGVSTAGRLVERRFEDAIENAEQFFMKTGKVHRRRRRWRSASTPRNPVRHRRRDGARRPRLRTGHRPTSTCW